MHPPVIPPQARTLGNGLAQINEAFRRSRLGREQKIVFLSRIFVPQFLVLGEVPVEKLAEGCAAVAVVGFFFRRQFREGFLNGRKIKERVIAESV